jgi:RNA polymerase sigma-70 factor (ECF subfamily)
MSNARTHTPVSLGAAFDRRAASDHELGCALVAGDEWAIAETWHRFAPDVTMLARRTLGSESEAEDIVQEVFHRLFKKSRTLREPDALRSFVFSFAIRVLRTELRRRRAHAWLSFRGPETLADVGTDVTDMESRALLRRFYSLLDRLAPRSRLVFALRRLESMTVDEVAARLELSPSTVQRTLRRASHRLARWIEADVELAGWLDEDGWLLRAPLQAVPGPGHDPADAL